MLRRSFLFLFCVLASPTSALQGAEQRARLELRVNQQKYAAIDVIVRGDDIMTRVKDLDSAGLQLLAGRFETIHGDHYVSVKSLSRQFSYELDAADLTLHVKSKPTTPGPRSPIVEDEMPIGAVAARVERGQTQSLSLPARLAVHLNGRPKGEINVMLRGGDVLARLKDIESLNLGAPNDGMENFRGEVYVSLASLASPVAFSVDEKSLSLHLAAKPRPSPPEIAADKQPPAAPVTDGQEATAKLTPRNPADQRAMLSVKVNEVKQGETDIILRGDDVLARVKDIQALGVISVKGRQENIRGEQFVSLQSLKPMINFGVNEKALSLDLTISPDAFGDHIIAGARNRPPKLEYREDTTGFLNYAVNVRDFKTLDAFSEAGFTVKNTHLYSGVSRNAVGTVVRGLSNATVSNRDNTNRFVIGDRLVNSDILGGNITMGGLSYFRDFALDPYLVRNPGLHYSGAVSTPSTLDVYSNGQLIRRIPLPPGQFELKDLPVPSGSNNTRFVIRDAFGRERELGSADFYFTSGLLTPGLHDFSYNIGTKREDLGFRNWSYGAPLFLGHHRYGFTDYLTGGMRFEASKGLASGGPSLSLLLPFGEMEIIGAVSTDRGRSGSAGFMGYNYVNQQFSFGSSAKFQSERYSTTSLSFTDARPWLETASYVAYNIPGVMSINLRYGVENSRDQGPLHRIRAFTSSQLTKRIRLFLDGFLDLKSRERSLGINAGVSFSFDDISASVSYLNELGKSNGLFDIRKSLPLGPGHGYGFQATTSGNLDSVLQYQTSFGRYEANYSRLDGHQRSALSASGGLAFIDGNIIPTRAIQDGFALLRLPSLGGVRGYLNNIEVGTTDSKGNLFVPSLLSYYGNKLSFSRTDLPLSHNVDILEKYIAPPYRGGVVVEFPVRRIQRIVGNTIIDKASTKIIPKHGQLTAVMDGQRVESILGNNGEFYFENLKSGRYHAKIEVDDQSCEFTLEIPEVDTETVQLGTLTCSMQ